MTLVNLCPHPVKIVTPRGVLDLPQAGPPARLLYLDDEEEIFDFGLLKRTKFTAVELPDPQPDTLFVVSTLVRIASHQPLPRQGIETYRAAGRYRPATAERSH